MSTEEFADFLYGAVPARLGRGARADAALRRPLRRGRRGADRRRRAPTCGSSIAGRDDAGRRRRRQHARAASSSAARSRTPPRATIDVRRSSRPCTRAARSRASGCASRTGRVVEASAETNEDFLARDARHRRRARGASASSASAATRASRATCATRCSTRRSTARCTSRSGNGLPDLGGDERVGDPLGHRQGPAAPGSRIELDGEVVQRDGAWLVLTRAAEPAPPATDRRARRRRGRLVARVADDLPRAAVVRALDDRARRRGWASSSRWSSLPIALLGIPSRHRGRAARRPPHDDRRPIWRARRCSPRSRCCTRSAC